VTLKGDTADDASNFEYGTNKFQVDVEILLMPTVYEKCVDNNRYGQTQ